MDVESRIPEKLFFKIGEVCELIRVQPHVLRYWETEFPMLAPQKNRAGQRVYRRKDVEVVMRIRDLLYEEKFTIAGAKKRLLDEMRGGSARVKIAVRDLRDPREAQEIREPRPLEAEPSAALETAVAEAAVQTSLSAPPPTDALPLFPSSSEPFAPVRPTATAPSPVASPAARSAVRLIRRDLEDLLTMLKSDASIRD